MTTDLESLYRDLHAHPELGFAEHRTAGIVAELMTSLGLEVTTGVGGTGVVAVARNGDGPVVYLRADMDGLPVREDTGLDYASTDTAVTEDGTEVPLMHACGHDVHVTCLVGAVEALMARRSEWSGTLVAVFQPAEETIAGAKAMVADGLAERFPRPTVVLGQHVAPFPAGLLALRAGTAMAGADSIDITFTGRGGHGSRPQTTIDPIVAASATVMRLQTIVSREVEPGRLAVVTVGSFHSGSKNNIIPATATLGLSVRSVDADSRDRMLASITRIAEAEAQASGMTVAPTIVSVERADATINAAPETERLHRRFVEEYGEAAVIDVGTASGSEDVGELAKATGAPLVFWFLGGCDPQAFAAATAAGTVESDIPSNHSPHFAPVISPTIERGVSHLAVAALEWLAEGRDEDSAHG
ncbi:amidohydrolase [Lacisediminihabitans sp.]|uniref:amidohydrolase n=1 Tax=Lacisediminihabitans sp. TaxID=2787631 RepID=UPI00374DB614